MFISRRKHEPAHYMLKIESFSLLSKAEMFKMESDVFEASGHKWRLDLYPYGNDKEDIYDHISLFVVICDTESCSKGWEVCADVTFFVYDHLHHNYVTFQDVNGHRTRFHKNKTTWGFNKLISLESLMEGENGYLFNDSFVFGAEVVAVPAFTQVDRRLVMAEPLETMNSYTWIINNFSAVTEDSLISQVFKVGNVKWKLSLYPHGDHRSQGTHLSLFLHVHNYALLPAGWKVYAKYKIRVKGRGTESDSEIDIGKWFCNSSSGWGASSFMLLSQLKESENGFLYNDNLIVEVEFSVIGALKNVI